MIKCFHPHTHSHTHSPDNCIPESIEMASTAWNHRVRHYGLHSLSLYLPKVLIHLLPPYIPLLLDKSQRPCPFFSWLTRLALTFGALSFLSPGPKDWPPCPCPSLWCIFRTPSQVPIHMCNNNLSKVYFNRIIEYGFLSLRSTVGKVG